MQEEYIQFGCGLCAPKRWRNFDAGPAFWLQKRMPFTRSALVRRGFPNYPANIDFGDIIRGLPVAPQSARAVYCSHVLEHLALEEFRIAIRNAYSYLRPGGTFRLVVPDLEFLAQQYIQSTQPDAASVFMRESHLGERNLVRGIRSLGRALFGRSKHFWMWDYKNIALELSEAGFVNIRRAQFGDAADPRFAEVEQIHRWENCLGVECSRR